MYNLNPLIGLTLAQGTTMLSAEGIDYRIITNDDGKTQGETVLIVRTVQDGDNVCVLTVSRFLTEVADG